MWNHVNGDVHIACGELRCQWAEETVDRRMFVFSQLRSAVLLVVGHKLKVFRFRARKDLILLRFS